MFGARSQSACAQRTPMQHRCLFVALGVAAVVSGGTTATVQTAKADELTEVEAIRRGLERGALRDVLEGQQAVARTDAIAAGVWPNPTAGYAHEQTSGALGSREEYAWLTQRFDLSGRRGLRVAAAEKRVRAASSAAAAQRLDMAAEIRLRFFTVLHHQHRLAALDRWASEVQESAAVVTKRQSAGDVAGYDRQRIGIEANAAEARASQETAALALARERLAAVTGFDNDAAGQELRVIGGLLPESPLPAVEILLEALGTRPDIQALLARSDAAGDESRAAARWWIPEVLLGGGMKSVETDGDRSTGFTAIGEVPLPLFDRDQASRGRAQAELMIARGELELERAKAEGEIRGLYAQATKLAAAAQAASTATANSTQLAKTAAAGYRGGELGIIELLDAQRSVTEADLRVVDLAWAARVARVELERITGGGLP